MAGVVVGVLALLVGGYGAIKSLSLQKRVDGHEQQITKIDGIEQSLNAVSGKADKAASDIQSISAQTQSVVNQLSGMIGENTAKIKTLEESLKKPAPVAGKGKGAKGGEPVVAGPGEYVVKPGDVSGVKIARENGVSLHDLMAVNPGVNWSKLHIGQKLKLPQKK